MDYPARMPLADADRCTARDQVRCQLMRGHRGGHLAWIGWDGDPPVPVPWAAGFPRVDTAG